MGKSRAEQQREYDKNNTKFYGIKLNLKTDKELINKLESAKNEPIGVQGYIKSLIRKDLEIE